MEVSRKGWRLEIGENRFSGVLKDAEVDAD